jgi:hypothetical protein
MIIPLTIIRRDRVFMSALLLSTSTSFQLDELNTAAVAVKTFSEVPKLSRSRWQARPIDVMDAHAYTPKASFKGTELFFGVVLSLKF